MTLTKQILNGSIWSLIGNSSYQASGLIIFVILSHILTPIDFGTAALAIVFVELSNVIVRYGLVEVVVRNTKTNDDIIENSTFIATLLLGLITCFLFVILSSYLELVFDAPGLAISLQILSVVPLMQALSSTPEGILRREFKFKALAIRLLCSAVFSGAVAIYLAYHDFGFYSLIIQKVISTAILLFLVWRSVKWRPSFNASYLNLIDILKQGQPILLSSLIGKSIFRFIELIVGYFLGVAVLGHLKIASKLLDAIVQFTIKPIVDVSFSAFANLKDSPIKLEECYLNFINTAALFSFPAFIGALVIGSDIVNLIFGKQWEISGVIFSILCLGGVSASLNYFFSQLCHASHNSHIPFRIRIIEFIVIITLVSISSQFSIYYVAYANVVVATLISFIMLLILNRKFSFSVARIIKSITPSFVSALFMGGVVYICLQTSLNTFEPLIKVIVSVGVGCGVYALFYRFVFPKKTSEIILNIKKLRK
ncbi:oligosaccharide flippase family protein [Psychromonas sp. 14N.309.X.WAT.B.A12]|uniref:oligosaccharide flippase family protein n=1 Tax=Psychromonas sp. 14N.309.X.WAT.B.A12 TaxID=2998322 RepID=UPI0025B07CF8|nr:oligosaccharide flippase family protein [Psychromonas sp. 14N.309.X.WAT.B.A12]MDN2664230.1 oligosaccharide flippase family protein [Psychromonas sp. 14N.309.X.WAT.B.A12]